MPLNPRPFHAAEPEPHPDGVPPGFRAWSQHVGDAAPAPARAQAPQPDLLGIDPAHPLLKVAAVAFVGYTLGRLLHRRPAQARRAAARRPAEAPTRVQPQPVAAARPPRSPREPRSDIRFR